MLFSGWRQYLYPPRYRCNYSIRRLISPEPDFIRQSRGRLCILDTCNCTKLYVESIPARGNTEMLFRLLVCHLPGKVGINMGLAIAIFAALVGEASSNSFTG